MNINYKKYAVLIPSLEPTEGLCSYVKALVECGFGKIVVVNDGSNPIYDKIFQEIELNESCVVLKHVKNYGKGVALKTGYQYIRDYLLECEGIITADSDGQHAIEDVCKVADKLSMQQGELILGSRDFSRTTIPVKSKIGNRFSSLMFFCLFGKWLPDTQTGLRGFNKSLLDFMLGIKGERFEYEMQVIIECVKRKITIVQVLIHTIYEFNNEGTHFQVLNDSVRVAKVIFGNFGKFLLSSLVSAAIDLSLAWFLLDLLKALIPSNDFQRIFLAVVIARLVSMIVNFVVNQTLVFNDTKKNKSAVIKYIMLCGLNMIASAFIVYFVSRVLGVSEKPVKLFGDVLLFVINYQVQRNWIFVSKQEEKSEK